MPPKKPKKRGSTVAASKPHPSKSKSPKGTDAKSRLQQAQKLVAKALRVGDCREEVILAGEAIQLSRDCADAYLILAQHAFHAIDALPFFEQARAAAARQLGREYFKKKQGEFWKAKNTKPYMLACGGFAECLWSVGRRDEAVEIWREMLVLNEMDHQGNRFLLQSALLQMQRTEEAIKVLDQFAEPSTWWDYNRLLAAIQQAGDEESVQKLLKQARKRNRHVIPLLLKDKLPKEDVPDLAEPGSSEEAAHYLNTGAAAWWQTPGAITWLRKASAKKPKAAAVASGSVGPVEESKQRLHELPQKYGVVYQAAVHQFAVWSTEGARHFRPWVIVMVDCNDRFIVTQEMLTERPSTHAVWDRIAQGLLEPFGGKPARPSEIQVYEHPVWDELRPHFEEVGIDIIYRKPVDEIDYILQQLQPVFATGLPEAGLLDAPGVTPELAGSYYAAAATFFRSAPWQFCSEERPIELRFSDEPDRVRYAVVSGQDGGSYGLMLHDDLQSVFDDWDGTDYSPDAVSVNVQFGEVFEMTAADLDAVERHAWPIATPEAHPSILRADPELMYCPPTANDLKWVEACLRIIPEFAQRNFRERSASETLLVTPGGVEVLKPGSKAARKKSGDSYQVQIAWVEEVAGTHDHDHDHDHDDGNCTDSSCSVHDHDECH